MESRPECGERLEGVASIGSSARSAPAGHRGASRSPVVPPPRSVAGPDVAISPRLRPFRSREVLEHARCRESVLHMRCSRIDVPHRAIEPMGCTGTEERAAGKPPRARRCVSSEISTALLAPRKRSSGSTQLSTISPDTAAAPTPTIRPRSSATTNRPRPSIQVRTLPGVLFASQHASNYGSLPWSARHRVAMDARNTAAAAAASTVRA